MVIPTTLSSKALLAKNFRFLRHQTGMVHIPAHREHPFRTNMNTYSGST